MPQKHNLLKEIRYINTTFSQLYGNQAYIELDEESTTTFTVWLQPNQGEFSGAKIPFQFTLPPNYPLSAPRVECKIPIYHCNISFSGSVCFNMFGGDGFSEKYSLETFINGLLWLLDNPNPDSPLNSTCVNRDPQQRQETIRESMYGLYSNTPTPYLQPGAPVCELKPSQRYVIDRWLLSSGKSFSEKPDFWTYTAPANSSNIVDVLIRCGADFKQHTGEDAPRLRLKTYRYRFLARLVVITTNEDYICQTPSAGNLLDIGPISTLPEYSDLVVLDSNLPDTVIVDDYLVKNARTFCENFCRSSPAIRASQYDNRQTIKTPGPVASFVDTLANFFHSIQVN